MTDTFKDIEKPEANLWAAADNLRANSKLTSSDYLLAELRLGDPLLIGIDHSFSFPLRYFER